MDDDLEALALLRADICKLWPPGQVRERWLAWAKTIACGALPPHPTGGANGGRLTKTVRCLTPRSRRMCDGSPLTPLAPTEDD
jgi:hypothetical protein